jgi:micrococcal nuclease
MKKLTFLFYLLILFRNGIAEDFRGKVVNVIDGNTLEVLTADNQTQKILLAGIDCPEPGQDYAEKAKKHLERLTLEKEVSVTIKGKDRWGNYLAIIIVTRNEVDPRRSLLEEGLAWTAEKNPLSELEVIRLKAVEKARGIWKEQNPKAPWIYRREQTMLQAKSS